MDEQVLKQLLYEFKQGTLSEQDLLDKLKQLPFESLGFATIDHHRALRKGFPEVIFAEGKTADQVVRIAERIVERGQALLVTRVSFAIVSAIREKFPDASYNESGRTVTIPAKSEIEYYGKVLVITAGTSDIPVAEEAAVTVDIMGHFVERLYDVGVAGIHRLFAHLEKLHNAQVLIVVAGMEGALASVIGGIVSRPVIAVPTSVGYGASFNGMAALLTMLNSCSAGITVVNIDNGFGAGYAASLILRTGRSN